jgi:hypothetical protein
MSDARLQMAVVLVTKKIQTPMTWFRPRARSIYAARPRLFTPPHIPLDSHWNPGSPSGFLGFLQECHSTRNLASILLVDSHWTPSGILVEFTRNWTWNEIFQGHIFLVNSIWNPSGIYQEFDLELIFQEHTFLVDSLWTPCRLKQTSKFT